MTTISKFYFHDVATPNTGTMPTGAFISGGDLDGDATGARTARDATDVIGVAQTSTTITSLADTTTRTWGYRRFVSRPLAAQTISAGTWTHSYACSESNLLHNQSVQFLIYVWRPTTGLQVGGGQIGGAGTEPTVAATETARSTTSSQDTLSPQAILDGDILVFEIADSFAQGMATSYTSSYFYDGTTEASTTSCASFVTPPAALTLFTAVTTPPLPVYVDSAVARSTNY